MTSYLYAALSTTLNIILNGLTLGRYIWLEGRVKRGRFRNWGRRFPYRPANFVQPTSEAEIVALVKNTRHLRVFGSGHSFNSGVVTDGALVSLDRYSGVLWVDQEKKQMAVRGGTRIRDINKALLHEGLAFRALPSHDAQSIAGIISTDVHGTGRDWGFVSQSVVRLKLIDGRGEIIECQPQDDLFRAAIGGIGAVGIIVEVVVQAVDRFNVLQTTEIAEVERVEKQLDQLLHENEHLSLYLFPFTGKCQINRWNRTDREQSSLGRLREFWSTSLDALLSVWFGDLFSHTKLLPRISDFAHGVKKRSDIVMESNEAFNRTIYPLHQELEFTVPYEETWTMARRFIDLYEQMFPSGLPYFLLELRFTPAGHDRTLIGAGRERRSTWIDVICNETAGWERFYAAAGELMKEVGARPHLGKFCAHLDRGYLARVHGQSFIRFRQLLEQHDPDRKFVNDFTRRLFEPGY